MSQAQAATDPRCNATVTASAGTGKTYLLVTRLLRLLLAGVAPERILAVTFTRKAAAEMQMRLLERTRTLAECAAAELEPMLAAIGVPAETGVRDRARRLYESLLLAPRPVRATTFHAFCQELLRRFPLEADVPPGFELVEATELLEEEAWNALFAEATREPDGALAAALQRLFEQCGDAVQTRGALRAFLHHRSDWWAFTEDQPDPVEFAAACLRDQLGADPDADPLQAFFTAETEAELAEYAALLRRHDTATNRAHAALLERALDAALPAEERFEAAAAAVFNRDGTLRKRKPSKTQATALGGAEPQAQFLDLHERIGQRIEHTRDQIRTLATFDLSRAWYRAGQRLLEHYQRIKAERRVLDFADLEWQAYRLLHREHHALWVQYKLDQRIDHLLVDEFQDTNPTQWRLLLPLLEELAAGAAERERSVFLVGDPKQSIYRFRRADSRLLESARRWLQERLPRTQSHELGRSWRSAPAILRAVNAVFRHPVLAARMPEFPEHATEHEGRWGMVEVLPRIEPATADAPARIGLRNPLREPRAAEEDERHYREGGQIAQRIQAWIRQPLWIHDDGGERPLGYQDILILLRHRTHADAYERALRDAGIPYLGAGRGTLLDSLEVRDLVALLQILVTPYDNLALAQVLRSPLFSASDTDLAALAESEPGSWFERLERLAPGRAATDPIARARRWLPRWQALADHVPVHDLLDRIFSEGNVLARYEAAFPLPLRPRVRANLNRLLGLALEVDSGRYPSLVHFLARLHELRERDRDAPDEAPIASGEARVRIMTIHAAKGLEAPVVFLADTASVPAHNRPYQALVRWPADADRPKHFLITGRKAEWDPFSRQSRAAEQADELREDANLLYVGMTRARQVLCISASATRTAGDDWYSLIRAAIEPIATERDGSWVVESGPMTQRTPPPPRPVAAPPDIDPRLSRPLLVAPAVQPIAPSRMAAHEPQAAGEDEDARRRGQRIHAYLAEITAGRPVERARRIVAARLEEDPTDPEFLASCAEAETLWRNPALQDWFDPAQFDDSANEVPVIFERDGRMVHGVIDRVVVRGDTVTILDYKTHRLPPAALEQYGEAFAAQLRYYAEGVRRLWPGRSVAACLVFTATAEVVPVALDSADRP